ncbi:metabolite transporter [Thermoplasma volcanium GSS1]|uniref:Metabolite transporter n=1 Tax=Thermoplasma volcanium (strain ATCC 51530 / DSM 4299 / JCM 9571 / NBRC 15438 / GSS1) TaxID=273116 RepID=Q97CU6_THEVO|nr:MFS transporter [Thermoplasma volcanium]BAB59147.1 metabolite transporter [Thermoplasma volcanium GSS1]
MAKGIIEELDNSKINSFHLRTWLIAGMGFFTDAYDLFVIGTVISILPLAGWDKLNTYDISILSSISLLASVIGAVIFGRLLDALGRKRVYGFELMLLILGALGSAFVVPVNGINYLIAWRFILGLGIGGDYAGSSTIMTEFSNTKNRGQLVGMVFSLQGVGLIAGPLITLGLLSFIHNLDLVWRVLFFIGAVPAFIVLYGRRAIGETPRYALRVKGDASSAMQSVEKISGDSKVSVSREDLEMSNIKWTDLFKNRYFMLSLIGTAGTWFLLDWAFYGNSIMSHEMLSALIPSSMSGLNKLKLSTFYTLIIFAVSAFPAYWIATFTVDRIGRKRMQVIGFLIMGITFGILGIFRYLMSPTFVTYFLLVYGISYFFTEFGPNVTTFIYAPEMFPTAIRGLGSGISSAGGKTGAFIGTALNVIIFTLYGEGELFLILAGISMLGMLMTLVLLPETSRRKLEDISGEGRYIVRTASGFKK